MTAHRCVPCGQPVADRYLCHGCEVRLHNNLTDLSDLNGELHTALTRMVRMSERADGGRSAEKPLVFNQKAAETIRLIRATLVAWVRELHNDTATPLPDRCTVTSLVDWLVPLIPESAAHRDDSAELYDEIRFLREKAQHVVDLPINRTVYEVGPCPEDVENTPCSGKVWVIIPRDEAKRPRMECRGCKTVWHGEQFERAGRRILARTGQTLRTNPDGLERLAARLLKIGPMPA